MRIAAAAASLLLLTACSSAPGPAPAGSPTPPTVIQYWCIDPVKRTVLDPVECTVDRDGDGYIDGHIYLPPPGARRPVKGEHLPAEVTVNPSPTTVISVP